MVVCKFYQQGYCKNGNKCTFEHTDPYHYSNPNPTSILRQPTTGNIFAPKPQQQTASVDTLVKSVVNEANAVEKGGQWLLSCYAPFKEKPPFPGLEDTSFEEVRWRFYEARQNGTLDQYIREIQQLLQTRIMQLRTLQNPSPEIVTMLKNIYDTPPSTYFGLNGSQVGAFQQNKSSNNSVFGGNSVFAQSNTPFGQQTAAVHSGSIFGGTQQQSSNVFGKTSVMQSGSIFAQPNNSIFAPKAQSPVATGSLFAPVAQPQPSNSIFGQNQQQTQQQSIFGQQPLFATAAPQFPQQLQQPPQQLQPQQQLQQPQQPLPQLQQPQQQLHQQPQQQQNSVFSGGSQFFTQSSAQHSQNIFGGAFTQKQDTNIDMTLYSKIEDLTQQEIDWFNSDTLDIASIPEKPPTYEMCH